MSKKKILVYIFILFIIEAAAAGALFYFYRISQIPQAQQKEVNYLIPGVPFNGIYNLYFQRADSTAISSVMDVLGYWGDERFNVPALKKIFMVPTSSPEAIFYPYEIPSIPKIQKFFEDNGYKTYIWFAIKPGGEINEIKKFVNEEKKIPVIVYQKRTVPETSSAPFFSVAGDRVVIGVFDNDKKIIVQDHDFGNNYEISYDDFEKMFSANIRAILAVWPSDSLKESLRGPNYSTPYPARIASMGKSGKLLATIGSLAIGYYWHGDFDLAGKFYEAMVASPDFKVFPPAFQINMLANLVRSYINLGKYDKAISILKQQILPMDHNLNQPFEGWLMPSQDKFVTPYFLLSQAYLKSGQSQLAAETYKEMVAVRDEAYKQTGDKDLLTFKIKELEK
jgi:hypothetical protein